MIAARVDDYGKGAWIALMVLGFCLWWPVGLATLAFIIFSGRSREWRMQRAGRWYAMTNNEAAGERRGCDPWGLGFGGFSGFGRRRNGGAPPPPSGGSGNRAFDEYRAETLRRLEEEQKEFLAYLERLRQAKDKQEFDQFMADRRRRSDQVIDVPA